MTPQNSDLSSVHSSVSRDLVEKRLKAEDDAENAYNKAMDNLVTIVHIDFPAYEKASFMDPAKRGKIMKYYHQDLE